MAACRKGMSFKKLPQHTCNYIYIWQLSSFRAPTLWFINLTVTTCHIQYTFLIYAKHFHKKTDKA